MAEKSAKDHGACVFCVMTARKLPLCLSVRRRCAFCQGLHEVQLVPCAQAMMKVNARGLTNVSWMLSDVEATFFPDAFFDAILCSSGVMYLQVRLLTWLA